MTGFEWNTLENIKKKEKLFTNARKDSSDDYL